VPRLRLPTRAPRLTRVILLIMDSVGIGALPDAPAYRDEGSDTLGHIAAEVPLSIPTLRSLGLGRVAKLGGGDPPPMGAYGRMAEASAGKDSVTGHWEIAGLVLDKPFPTFPNGFSSVSIEQFEGRIGRRTLGNVVGSGTEIIDRFGEEHLKTGAPIVYTSADSVFQIAAHEEVVSIDELYRMCHEAFEIYARGLGVARVIARPFVGTVGQFTRTANRRDFAVEPPHLTLLDLVLQSGRTVVAIGKIEDLFAGRGISRAIHTTSDDNGMDVVLSEMSSTPTGLIMTNLVDFDSKYGHRNDVPGYAANLERFDVRLAEVLGRLRPSDLLVVTADHGNDPSTRSTDHSREYVPVLVAGPRVRAGADLGTRATFADLGQTIADLFGIRPLGAGTSFLPLVLR